MYKPVCIAIVVAVLGGCETNENEFGKERADQVESISQINSAQSDNQNVNYDDARMASAQIQFATLDNRQFVQNARSAGILEEKLGELGLIKGDIQVQEFSAHLIQEHRILNDQLKAIAQEKGLAVADQMLPEHQAMYDALASLTGDEFNQKFLKTEVEAHQQAVELFQNAATNLYDRDLKSFATRNLPKMRDYLGLSQTEQTNFLTVKSQH